MERAVHDATNGFPANPDKVVPVLTEDGLLAAMSVSDNARPWALLLEQGLRLAGLVHDLGHLPFSHDFEYALERLFEEHRGAAIRGYPALTSQGDLAIHERIGYHMAKTLVHKIFVVDDGLGQFEADLARSSFAIAELILLAKPPPDPGLAVTARRALDVDALWRWLHSLMAGEIDVDRCDYLLRDARNYGFEFASYDLDRLVNHLTVARPREDRNLLETAMLPQGVSAAESFYLARYRAYTWGPFHHKVSQIAAALQQSILLILLPTFSGGGHADLVQFLEDIETVANDNSGQLHNNAPDLLDRFRHYDDGWLMRYIREAAQTGRASDQQAWLDLVCWRKHGPKSLWKRSADFPGSLRAFNAALPDPNDPNAATRWRTTVDRLSGEGVLVIRHRFSPYGREPGSKTSTLKVSDPDGKLRPLTDISHMTAALPALWKADVQVFAASAYDPPRQSAAQVVRQLRSASRKQGVRP
jgi:HD superfamily phosphohydrolase